MRGWLRYALLATAIVAVAVAVAAVFSPANLGGALVAGATALTVQLGAFAVLAPARGKPNLVLAAWVFGVLVRLGVVLGLALWLTRGGPVEARPTLLMLVVLLMLLALLEAPALRRLERTDV